MKRIVYFVLAAFLFCGFNESAFAQTDQTIKIAHQHGTLTPQQEKDLDYAVRKKVYNMAEQLKKIANKRYTNREKFVKEARNEFINYCLPYNEYVTDINGNVLKTIKNKGVLMETATATKTSFTVAERLMRVYLYNLMRLNYRTVKITNTDFVNMKSTKPVLDHIDKDGNEVYKCLVVYVQRCEVETHERVHGIDDTTKIVEVYIKKIEILNAQNQIDYVFSIKLGDVLVESLEKTDPSKNIELLPDEDLF